jgi:hypothetical protein
VRNVGWSALRRCIRQSGIHQPTHGYHHALCHAPRLWPAKRTWGGRGVVSRALVARMKHRGCSMSA